MRCNGCVVGAARQECVLLYDTATGEFTLEQVSSKMNLKHQRARMADAIAVPPMRRDIAKVGVAVWRHVSPCVLPCVAVCHCRAAHVPRHCQVR